MMYRLIIAFLALNSIVVAQEYHFSQFNKTQMLLNPAITGFSDGFERFGMNHRSQWIGSGTQFFTSAASAEMTIGKDYDKSLSYLGLGLNFVNDMGGDSKMRTTSGAANISGILPINYLSTFSVGINVGYTNRNADLNRVLFPSQWNGSMYDPTLPSGEESFTSFGFLDAGAGIFYHYGKNQTKVIREKDLSFEIGVSAFHLNRPKLRYNGVSMDILDMRFIGIANLYYTFTEITGLEFNVMQAFQGKHMETSIGAFIKNRFSDGSRKTSNYHDSFFSVGAFVRTSGMFIPAVQFDWRDYQFGFSYDVMLSKMRRAYPGGSFEVSLVYRTRGKSLFKAY
jgi:type IX secretion system PorP/SprF family membrane protein